MYEYLESRNYIDIYRLLFCDREIPVPKIEYFFVQVIRFIITPILGITILEHIITVSIKLRITV